MQYLTTLFHNWFLSNQPLPPGDLQFQYFIKQSREGSPEI